MKTAEIIEGKLTAALSPARLSVIDESHHHVGHVGHRPEGETHFRVEIVSAAFEGKTRSPAAAHGLCRAGRRAVGGPACLGVKNRHTQRGCDPGTLRCRRPSHLFVAGVVVRPLAFDYRTVAGKGVAAVEKARFAAVREELCLRALAGATVCITVVVTGPSNNSVRWVHPLEPLIRFMTERRQPGPTRSPTKEPKTGFTPGQTVNGAASVSASAARTMRSSSTVRRMYMWWMGSPLLISLRSWLSKE